MSQKLYNVGIYIRLSRENTEYVRNESFSIENQQAMLSKFTAIMPGWVEKRVYIDNGASGGNFNRRGFQDMMSDVRSGEINLVLVQDLSRFGRNYLESGKYLEDELPALGCRFVSLSDGIDTEDGESDIMPFLNAMNDYYLKNLSDKIKSVFLSKAKAGHKLTGTPPYGYKRGTDDNRKLVVDDYAAGVVRRIFNMRVEGLGYSKIVGVLNAENILPPKLYYYQRTNREPKGRYSQSWLIHTVPVMLRDEGYLGHTNSFKRSRNYRSSKAPRTKKDKWLKIENTHEAIIDRPLWDKVQEVNARLSQWTANARKPQFCLYVKKIFCADCKKPMAATGKWKGEAVIRETSYSCSQYHVTGRQECTRHTMAEEVLNKILLEDIKEQTAKVLRDEKGMTDNLLKKLIANYAAETFNSRKQLQELRLKLHQLDLKLEQLYEDKVTGTISPEMFLQLSVNAELHWGEIALQVERLEQHNKTVKAKRNDIQNWIRLIKENLEVKDVNRDLLDALIERVEIGEKRVENGVKTQDVRIFYKFVGTV